MREPLNETPYLGLPHIHAHQGQKEVTANQFADGLDTAIAGSMIIPLDQKTQYTLTTVEARQAILIFTGVLTAPTTIIIPAERANRKFIVMHHGSGDLPLLIQHPDTAPVTLQPDQRCWIVSDGTQFYSLMHA